MSVHQCPCFTLGLAHRKVARAFEEALAPLGLTIAQAHFLSCLYATDGQLPKDLARELGVDAGTLTPMIDRLERMGLVTRCPHPEDRRAIRLFLTEAAERIRPEVQARCDEVNERLMSKLSPEDYTRFLALVRQLTEEAETVTTVR